MADVKKLAEELVNLKVTEVNELAQILKEEYGIEPAAAAVAVAAPAAGAGEAAPAEKTSFDVILKSAGQAKATPAQPQGKVFGQIRENAKYEASSQSAKHAREAAFSVDLRGLRSEDALQMLQANLDKAYLAEQKELEVIHGRGTGALRKAVHAYLATCSQVSSYVLAPADRGGDGMTIVTLR